MATITLTDYAKYEHDIATRTGQIDYYVRTTNIADNPLLATQPGGATPAIPGLFTPHPFDTNSLFPAKVDKQEVTAMDATGLNWRVRLLYSSDGRFRFNPHLNLVRLTSEAFVREDFKYPILNSRPIQTVVPVFNQPPGTPLQWTTRYDWVKQDGVRVMFHENFQVRIVLGVNGITGAYDQTAEALIRAQIGKFHYLAQTPYTYQFAQNDLVRPPGSDVQWPTTYPELWQFNGCDVEQVGTSTWNLTYSWTRDPGNGRLAPDNWTPPITVPPSPNDNVIVYPLARPPFFVYKVYQPAPLPPTPPATTPTTFVPRIYIVPTYAGSDNTGYAGAHSLPGNPV